MRLFGRDAKTEALRRIPLFAQLSRRQLELLALNADAVDVPPGTRIVREGELGQEFFAIEDGEVEVTKGGKRIATERSGDFFGEIALLENKPRTATVTTIAPSRLFVLTAQAFRSLLADAPAVRSAALARED
jgi:CRP-like cAMP-binding protein